MAGPTGMHIYNFYLEYNISPLSPKPQESFGGDGGAGELQAVPGPRAAELPSLAEVDVRFVRACVPVIQIERNKHICEDIACHNHTRRTCLVYTTKYIKLCRTTLLF